VRLRRCVGSIRFWIALCACLRLAALLLLPIQGGVFLNREMPATGARASGYLEFLQRRTDVHPLTEDEHCYDEMAQNIRRGRGFVVDSPWIITTPGAPAMYGGCAYPLFVAAVYTVFSNGRELPVVLLQIALQCLAVGLVFQTSSPDLAFAFFNERIAARSGNRHASLDRRHQANHFEMGLHRGGSSRDDGSYALDSFGAGLVDPGVDSLSGPKEHPLSGNPPCHLSPVLRAVDDP
jgi:hypothetical protein